MGKNDNNIKILGFGLFIIGLVLVIESLLILLLISNIRLALSQATFLAGIGYVIFKIAAGFIAMFIGIKPVSPKKRKRK
ncbi:MAG: hypothetical protein HYT72_00495 [Candidatus Aenigmarchaeota archaeon]|nr:hypothetical protein [Candidatus Aenigmarchaeota archaeon]